MLGRWRHRRGRCRQDRLGGGVVRVEAPESSLEAIAVIQGRGGEVRAGDRVGAVGVERSGSCRDTAEEVAEVIGPGINQMLGIRAREGYEGSVLEAAQLGDSDGDDNSELKIRAYAKPLHWLIHLSPNSLIS